MEEEEEEVEEVVEVEVLEEKLAVKELRVEPPGACTTLPESPSSILAECESPHLIKFG